MNIKCPIPDCGCENPPEAARCQRCGANLQAYSRLLFLPDYLFNRGLNHAHRGELVQAESALQAALAFNPKNGETLLLLAAVQSAVGSPAAAVTLTQADQVVGEGTPWKAQIGVLKTLLEEAQNPPLSAHAAAQMKARAQQIAQKHKKHKGKG